AAVEKLVQGIIRDHGAVLLNGDGYSEAWHREAERRGLPNLRTTPEALKAITSKEVAEVFRKFKLLSKRELESREEIYLERYVKDILIEAKLTLEMGRTLIFPAAIRYPNELAQTCANLKAVGYTFDTDTLDKVTALVKKLQDGLSALEPAMARD